MNDRDAADIILARITDEEQMVVDTMSTREINALKKAYIALMDKANQPSCGDCVSREAAADVLCEACGNVACPRGLIPRCFFYEKMMELPAANQKAGEWQKRMEHTSTPTADHFEPVWSCPFCGTEYDPGMIFALGIRHCFKCGKRLIDPDAHDTKGGVSG